MGRVNCFVFGINQCIRLSQASAGGIWSYASEQYAQHHTRAHEPPAQYTELPGFTSKTLGVVRSVFV